MRAGFFQSQKKEALVARLTMRRVFMVVTEPSGNLQRIFFRLDCDHRPSAPLPLVQAERAAHGRVGVNCELSLAGWEHDRA